MVASNDGSDTATVTDTNVPSTASAGAPEVGAPAPDFELRTLDGARVSLGQLRGRPVIVNFWASYCHPCRQEFPLLKQVLADHRDDDLAVVGIVHQDIASDARAFVEDQRAQWPMGNDAEGTVARAYGVRPIPQTFFIDRDGVVRARIFGEMSARDLQDDLRTIIPPT